MPTRGRSPWPVWLSVGVATVALHGCVLDAVWPAWAGEVSGGRALQVRMVSVEAAWQPPVPAIEAARPAPLVQPLQPPTLAPMPAPTADMPTAKRTTRRADRGSPAAAHMVPVLDTVDSAPAATVDAVDRSDAVHLATAANDLAPAEATSTADATPAQTVPDAVPTYRTAPPPATRLAYDLKHGILTGQGEIDWLPAGPRYELKLEGRIANLTLLTQISSGGFDAHGLAPERYTDQRMKRAVNAANLQRASGKITFSGPDTQYPLLPGTQDRVSWMVQLASIVNAQPQLAMLGAKVTLFVVGARGEGDVWVFACTGNETVDTGMGPMPAAKFIREPTKPHDTQVEAWLAPQLHGLPAHARLSNGNDGALDLILREAR